MTSMRLELTPDRLNSAPGDKTTVTVSVRNVSSVVQHYETSVLGLPPGTTATATPPLAKLRPSERATVKIDIAFPSTPPPRAGDYTLGVLLRSPHDSTVSRCEELPLRIDEVEGVELVVEPQLLEGGAYGRFATTVVNNGNSPARVHLRGKSRSGQARFVFSPTWVDVPAGGRSVADASVSFPTPWTGQPQQRELTVTGAIGEPGSLAAESTTTLVLTQKAKLAPAALRSARGLVTLGVGAGTVLGAALLTRQTVDVAQDQRAANASESAAEASSSSASSSGGETPTDEPSTDPVNPTPSVPVNVRLFEPPGVPAAAGDQSVGTDAFADGPISVVAGLPDPTSPDCAQASGLAVFNAGSPDGYAQPAMPLDPTVCHNIPLQVFFNPPVAGVEVFLAEQSTDSYQMLVTVAGRLSPVPLTQRVGPPREPDFAFAAEDAVITDVVIKPLISGVGADIPTGVSEIIVTPAGS